MSRVDCIVLNYVYLSPDSKLLVEQTFIHMNVCTCIYLIVIRLEGWEALLFAFIGAYTIFAQNWQDLVMALVKIDPSGECQWSVLYCLCIVKVNIFLFLLT